MATGGIGGRIDKLTELLRTEQKQTENVSNRDFARTLVFLAVSEPDNPAVAEIEGMLGVAPGELRALHQRLVDRSREESAWAMKAMRDALPKMAKTSVPSVPRNHERLQAPQIRLDGQPQRRDGRPLPRVLRRRDQ